MALLLFILHCLLSSTTVISRFLFPKGGMFQGPDAPGADAVAGFRTFMDNSMLCNKYPIWWLKTFPVKSYKLASDAWARSIAAQKELVQETMEKYSSSTDADDQTFLEQWVEQGKSENEIAFLIGGLLLVATDTVSFSAGNEF